MSRSSFQRRLAESPRPAALCVLALISAGGCLSPVGIQNVGLDSETANSPRGKLTPARVMPADNHEPGRLLDAVSAVPPGHATDTIVATRPASDPSDKPAIASSLPAASPPPTGSDLPAASAISGPSPVSPNSPLPFVSTQIEEIPAPARPLAVDDGVTGQLSVIQQIKPIQSLSTNVSPPALYDDAGSLMLPPQNDAAEAIPQLALQQPISRGELIDYRFVSQPAPPGLEFCYQPLYFEEVNVERYGRSWGVLQPAVSMVNFYGRIPLVPYMVFSRPARRCTYHAHWTLPGYRIPCRERHTLVPSASGGAAETAAIFGLILLIP